MARPNPLHLAGATLALGALLCACSDAPATGQRAFEVPPPNPFLARSSYAIGHADAAQSDSSPVHGPLGPSEALTAADISYRALGPGHFGAGVSSPYPDGRRVVWSNGRESIVKLDHETFEVLASYAIPGMTQTPIELMDEALAELDTLTGVERQALALQLAARYLTGLGGVYYVLDVDNSFFVGGTEEIVKYSDADPRDPASPIVEVARWRRPAEITGEFVGVNMTYDGRLVLATENGWVLTLTRDFAAYESLLLPFAVEEDAAGYSARKRAETGRGGNGWVRNSMAVGDDGGIYVASLNHLHKVIWDGAALHADPGRGAWSERFSNGAGNGTGATPSLMGFGDEDRFVVITDGDALMNVVLLWRDDIPAGWRQLPGAPSRRIAGQLPADMGDPARTAIQSEQSVVVAGYGALVVNNEPASIPPGFPPLALRLLVSYLGDDPAFTPHGVQKFEWDPAARALREAWINREVASPNTVPLVSIPASLVYTGGVRERQWTVEALDWTTGRSAFHWVLGGARYNGFFSGVVLDEGGRVVLGAPFGKFRIER
ncbi:MAG: hypothetical protein AB1689_03670 [Thermodesulfobacteriota bacterium]